MVFLDRDGVVHRDIKWACSQSVRSCIAREHLRSFGAERIVGDDAHWRMVASHMKQALQGQSWAVVGANSTSNNPCGARDGWGSTRSEGRVYRTTSPAPYVSY